MSVEIKCGTILIKYQTMLCGAVRWCETWRGESTKRYLWGQQSHFFETRFMSIRPHLFKPQHFAFLIKCTTIY